MLSALAVKLWYRRTVCRAPRDTSELLFSHQSSTRAPHCSLLEVLTPPPPSLPPPPQPSTLSRYGEALPQLGLLHTSTVLLDVQLWRPALNPAAGL